MNFRGQRDAAHHGNHVAQRADRSNEDRSRAPRREVRAGIAQVAAARRARHLRRVLAGPHERPCAHGPQPAEFTLHSPKREDRLLVGAHLL